MRTRRGGFAARRDGSFGVMVSPSDLFAALDAVLVPRGFAAAQLGGDGVSGQAIWCCGAAAFTVRHSWWRGEDGDDGCVDLVVDLARQSSSDKSLWQVTRVELEGRALGEELRRRGDPSAAARADALVGARIGEVHEALVAAVVTILDAD